MAKMGCASYPGSMTRILPWILLAATLPAQPVIDVHQHYARRANYFEDLDRVYRAHNARACVNGSLADQSYPIQDEHETGTGFQCKMSMKMGRAG